MSITKSNFKKVRRLLPYAYSGALAKRLGKYSASDVRKAFAGQIKNQEVLAQILAGATDWAEELKRKREKQLDRVNKLTMKARKRA